VLTVLIIAAAGASIALMTPKTARSTAAKVAAVWTAVPTETPAPAGATIDTAPAEAAPTPYFATFRGQKLHLPVAPTATTVLAFHQSSYNDSYPMKSLLKEGSATAAVAAMSKAKSTAKVADVAAAEDATQNDQDSRGVWKGTALELWRTGRMGALFTAIDCGAKAGTPVCSPVDGTVMEIRRYKLYGKYDDIEINIKPDLWSDVDVVMLHVTNPTVTEGQHLIGGVTEIAHVRKLSSLMSDLQLRSYSVDGGNHTHVQINRIPKPGLPWILGEDPPGLVRKGN
jgi:hypothetical protein